MELKCNIAFHRIIYYTFLPLKMVLKSSGKFSVLAKGEKVQFFDLLANYVIADDIQIYAT